MFIVDVNLIKILENFLVKKNFNKNLTFKELKDLTNIEALNNQVERLGDMIELNADYMQDLKHQIKSLPNSNYDDLLKRVDEAQHLMYQFNNCLVRVISIFAAF